MGLFGKIMKGSSGNQGKVESGQNITQSSNQVATQGSGTFRVIDVYDIKGVGVIPVGEIMSGQLAPGMKTNLNGKTVEIKSIEMNHQRLSVANVGDKVGMSLKGAKKEDLQKGQIINFSRDPESASAREVFGKVFG